MMRKQSDFLARFQVVTFNVAMFFVAAVAFVAGWYLLGLRLSGSGGWLLLYASLFLLATGLVWAWLWVMVKIPQEMAARYDEIKNRIASGAITDSKEFSHELARFLVRYFNFYRFDVVAAQVKVGQSKAVHFSDEGLSPVAGEEEFSERSRQTEALIRLGTVTAGNRKLYGYLVPVWFDEKWLGYFAVFTDTRLLKVYQNYLTDFEAYYVDDQLMYVLQIEQLSGKEC